MNPYLYVITHHKKYNQLFESYSQSKRIVMDGETCIFDWFIAIFSYRMWLVQRLLFHISLLLYYHHWIKFSVLIFQLSYQIDHLTPINYPFGIEGWDAEELDLFNQDVSGVDVEVIHLWYQFFIMKGDVEKVLLLRTMMKNEPRFRDYRTAQQLLSPFDFLENWNVRIRILFWHRLGLLKGRLSMKRRDTRIV